MPEWHAFAVRRSGSGGVIVAAGIIGGGMDPVIRLLGKEGRERLEELTRRRWVLPGEHPLAALHGATLDGYRLIVLLGPKSSVGSQSYQLLLGDSEGTIAQPALALGLFNRGPYPAFNWVEMTRYDSVVAFAERQLDLVAEGLDLPLLQMLSDLVPAGGHLMVEYDSPSQRATERMLTLGYPPAVTPIGFSLFQVGCRSFKNWHISEGWREGPRKLQGFKPWNAEIAAEKTNALREELVAFRERSGFRDAAWGDIALRNVEAILELSGR